MTVVRAAAGEVVAGEVVATTRTLLGTASGLAQNRFGLPEL